MEGPGEVTNRGEVEALRQHVECPAVASAIDQKIAELKAGCNRDTASLSSIGASDAGALRSFIGKATCDDAKTNAQTRLATLEADALTEPTMKKTFAAGTKTIGSRRAHSANRRTSKLCVERLECPAIVALADKALADLKATCARETANLNGLAAGDTNGARALADKAICDDVRTAAGLKLAAMEADSRAKKKSAARKILRRRHWK